MGGAAGARIRYAGHMERFVGVIGMAAFVGVAMALSSNRGRIRWRVVAWGVGLQVVIAALCLRNFVPGVDAVGFFEAIARLFTRVISFGNAGVEFLFGKAMDASQPWGFIFVVKVLPIIIFFAALMSVMYHLRIMQVVVAGVAWVLRRTLGITGAEAISAAANIFVGQTEAPLLVRPYIAGMTRSQIMCVMTCGFATIAGSVMAAYVGILGGEAEESKVLFAKHLLTASVMSAPAGILMAKIMLPEEEIPRDESLSGLLKAEVPTSNVVDAAVVGATDGLKLAMNVAAMLVAFVSLIALIDWPLEAFWGVSFASVLGFVFRPVAWCMGVPWKECGEFGAILGTGVIATEFKAYLDLAAHIRDGTMSPRACQIATYALCGFCNIPSIGIQIGGFSALAPERRQDFVKIAPRAMVAGMLACWMTGAVAGVFI